MWKHIFLVMCLVYVVYGAPQAPPAEEKYEPVITALWILNTFLK